MRLRVGVHARARVADLEHHVGAGRRRAAARRWRDFACLHVGGADHEPSPVGHGVAGIDGQVHDHLLDLAGVCLDSIQRRLGHDDEVDRLADEPLQHGLHAGHDAVELQHLGREHLLAAEGEELARQGGRLVRRLADALGVLAQGVDRGQAPEHQVAVAADDHEQVVEVVRDTARELAHRVHLLRLPEMVLARAQRLVRVLELGQVHGEAAELSGIAGTVRHHVHDVAQPHDLARRGQGPVLELVILATGEGGAALGHDLGAILGVDALAEPARLLEPALGGKAEDGLGALADEREAQGGRIGFPHDGVEALHEILEALLRGEARRLEALLLGQVLDDEEQARFFLLLDADARHGDAHGARLVPVKEVKLEEHVGLGDAGLHHLAGATQEALGTDDVLEGVAHDVVATQEERFEEGAVRGEHAQVGGEQEQARRHRGDDLLGVTLQVEDGALLLHLVAEQGRALALAPEADQHAGQGQGEEGARETGQLACLVEVGQRLFAIDLEDETPAGRRDPARGREDGGGAIVEHLAEGLAPVRRALGARDQVFEGAVHGRPARGLALEGRDVAGLGAVDAEEQGLAGAGGDRLVGEEREEPRGRIHHEGNHADHGSVGADAVAEDGHADHEELPGGFLDEVGAHGAVSHREEDGLRALPSGIGGARRAREGASLRVHERDAGVAVGGGHAIELGNERAPHVAALAAALEHEGAHGRGGGEHVGVGAPGVEPVGDEPRASLGDGGHARLPVREHDLALALDLVPDERRDERGSEEEGGEVSPGQALACPRAEGTRPTRGRDPLVGRTGKIGATDHACCSTRSMLVGILIHRRHPNTMDSPSDQVTRV